MPFWDRTIELMILTHPSADHVTGLIEVLNRYEVEQVLYPDLDFDSAVYNEWLGVIQEKEIECTLAQSGQQISMDNGVVVEVLNPGSPLMTGTESDVDNNGVMLHLSKGEVSFLLTADIMWEAELELIYDRANLNSTVLKVGHHGSDTSTTEEFLAVVDPRLAVISVGADNKFGHPVPEVVARLNEQLGSEYLYRTDINGTVEFITDGETLRVITEKQ
jgi:competence protein ComEC